MSDWSRSTSIQLEALTVNGIAESRATTLVLEVTSTSDSPVHATAIYLEVLTKAFEPVPYVPDNSIPWTVKPDWGTDSSSGVTERLRWRTDVLASATNIEQRRRIRNSPRMEVDCSFVLWRQNRRMFDSLVSGRGNRIFHLPLWWEKYQLQDAMGTGDYVMNFDTVGSGIAKGSRLMILGETPFIFEIVEVHSVTDNSVLLANTVAQAWSKGTSVYLTKKARIGSSDVGLTRRSDEAVEAFVSFEVVDPNDYPAIQQEQVGETYPQFDFSPAFLNDITYSYHRVFSTLDNEAGIALRRDAPLQAFNILQLDHIMRNKAEYRQFKEILYFLQGKLQPFRLSTYFNDLQYLEYASTVDADSHLFVRRCGLSEHIGASTGGRQHIAVHFRDGTVAINEIVICSVVSDEVEAVIFTNTWNRSFSLADIKRISYSQVVRQDQDDIEILHVTDIHGGATCTTTFMTLSSDVRGTSDYSLNYYTGVYVRNADAPALPVVAPAETPPPETPEVPFYGEYAGGQGGEGDGSDSDSDAGDDGTGGANSGDDGDGAGSGDGEG